MEGKILVSLKSHDRIEEIFPYIEKIAQPGMKVVFFIPYPVKLWPWVCDHWVTTESRTAAIVAGKKIIHEYSWEVQKTLAEQKISLARDALHKKQVEVVVNICMSSMSRAIKDHGVDREVRLVLWRAGSRHPLINLLRRTLPFSGAFKRPVSPRMLLFYPGQ